MIVCIIYIYICIYIYIYVYQQESTILPLHACIDKFATTGMCMCCNHQYVFLHNFREDQSESVRYSILEDSYMLKEVYVYCDADHEEEYYNMLSNPESEYDFEHIGQPEFHVSQISRNLARHIVHGATASATKKKTTMNSKPAPTIATE